MVDSRQGILDEKYGTFNSSGKYIPYPKRENDTFNFVTAGRLSPEKQHQLLIQAFKDELLHLVSELQIQ